MEINKVDDFMQDTNNRITDVVNEYLNRLKKEDYQGLTEEQVRFKITDHIWKTIFARINGELHVMGKLDEFRAMMDRKENPRRFLNTNIEEFDRFMDYLIQEIVDEMCGYKR